MRKERHGPDHRELGRPIATSALLGRSRNTAILLQGIQVYSDGFCINVDGVRIRREELDVEWSTQWEVMSREFLDVLEEDNGLKIRVATDDGALRRDLDVVFLNGYQQGTRTTIKTNVLCWVKYPFGREPLAIGVSWYSAGIKDVYTDLPNNLLETARKEIRRVL